MKFIDSESFSILLKEKPTDIKILDVRDQVDYYADHVDGAINISLGRLPYVKKTEFRLDDEIIIVSDSKYHGKKAAKILKQSGFQRLTYLVGGMSAFHQSKNGSTRSNKFRLLRQT